MFDQEGLDMIDENLKKRRKEQNCADTKEVQEIVRKAANDTRKRRGKPKLRKKVGKTCLKKALKAVGAKKRVAQQKTNARIIAESDPRNFISMFSFASAFSSDLPPEMIFNWDATQFEVGGDAKECKVWIVGEENDGIRKGRQAVTKRSKGKLNMSIKLYHLHNAAGYCGIPVFVVACASLKADDLVVLGH
jgi:hypothetical protein